MAGLKDGEKGKNFGQGGDMSNRWMSPLKKAQNVSFCYLWTCWKMLSFTAILQRKNLTKPCIFRIFRLYKKEPEKTWEIWILLHYKKGRRKPDKTWNQIWMSTFDNSLAPVHYTQKHTLLNIKTLQNLAFSGFSYTIKKARRKLN